MMAGAVELLELEEGVCVSCVNLCANGDETASTPEEVAAFVAGAEREAGWELVLDCPEDCTGWFSWSACGWCRSPLGGDRHPAVLVRRG